MDAHKSEEEQIAALKKWWSDNGNSLLMGIGAALLAVVGWKFYETKQEEAMNQASTLYGELLEVSSQSQQASAGDASTVDFIADQIKTDHSDTEYAIFAALFTAKEAVKKNELDKAISELDWVIEKSNDVRIDTIATARKARILSAQDKHDEALALLESPQDEAFKVQYFELQGDIYARKGDKDAAITAYGKAYATDKERSQRSALISVKLASLGVKADEL